LKNKSFSSEITFGQMLVVEKKAFSRYFSKRIPLKEFFPKYKYPTLPKSSFPVTSSNQIRIGIDVGSTTVKVVALSPQNEIIFSNYRRHKADVINSSVESLQTYFNEFKKLYPSKFSVQPIITGSGNLSISELISINFIQEVVASTCAVTNIIPETDITSEFGGEDAKSTYFKGGIEQRMNETCAGGTGAFIDQMADLLQIDVDKLNKLLKNSKNDLSNCKSILNLCKN
jgi:activator of 2-hydroxyglutaryl-CoA dehydratase